MPVRYISSCVWVRLSMFSPLSVIQYVGLYVIVLPISVVMIEIIYIYSLSYCHQQIGSMNYYPLFRVRSWNNGVRCMYFFILRNTFSNIQLSEKIWESQIPERPEIQTRQFRTMLHPIYDIIPDGFMASWGTIYMQTLTFGAWIRNHMNCLMWWNYPY